MAILALLAGPAGALAQSTPARFEHSNPEWSAVEQRYSFEVTVHRLERRSLVPVDDEVAGAGEGPFLSLRRVAGAALRRVPGEPELPVLALELPISPGAEVGEPVVEVAGRVEWPNVMLAPTRPPWNEAEPVGPVRRAGPVYARAAYYPPRRFELGAVQVLRGQTTLRVEVHPVRFNPVGRRVEIVERLRVQVPIPGNDPSERTAADQLYSSAFAVPLARRLGALYDPPAGQPEADRTNGCDYLVITTPAFKDDPALARFLQQKRKQGLLTQVRAAQTPLRLGPGHKLSQQLAKDAQTPSRLKQQREIVGLINQVSADFPRRRPTYLLLIGTAAQLTPCFLASPVDGAWVASDAPYGSTELSEVKLDLLVGRFPAADATELQRMIRKTEKYQAATAGGEKDGVAIAAQYDNRIVKRNGTVVAVAQHSYLETAAAIATFLDKSRRNVKTFFAETVRDARVTERFFLRQRRVESEVARLLEDDAAARARLIRSWDADGLPLLIHRGHGNAVRWALPSFSAAVFQENEHKYDVDDRLEDPANTPPVPPVVLSINCSTGAFVRRAPQETCFAEYLLRSEQGACAVIAPAGDTFDYYNDRLLEGMMQGVLPGFRLDFQPEKFMLRSRRQTQLGVLLRAGLVHMETLLAGREEKPLSRLHGLLYHCFGDPALPVFEPEPRERLLARYLAGKFEPEELLGLERLLEGPFLNLPE